MANMTLKELARHAAHRTAPAEFSVASVDAAFADESIWRFPVDVQSDFSGKGISSNFTSESAVLYKKDNKESKAPKAQMTQVELPAELELTDEQVELGITLYAVWERLSAKISYDLAGGAFASDANAPESYLYGEKVSLPTPEKQYFEFVAWTLNGEEISEIAESQEGDVALVATWVQVETPITYVLVQDGATLPDAESTFATDEGIEDLMDDEFIPKADGYIFAGWYFDAEYTQAATEIPADTTDAVTIYAKWEQAPVVEGDNWVGVK